MERSRHSRRSACERCRNYKLRCERSGASPRGHSCDRCLRTGALCVTATKATETRSLQPYASPRHSFGEDLGTIAVRTPLPPAAPLAADRQPPRAVANAIEVGNFGDGLEVIENTGATINDAVRRQSPLSFSLSSFTFPGAVTIPAPSGSPDQQRRDERSSGSLSSIFGDMPELGDPEVVLPSPTSFDTPLTTRRHSNPHQEAFELGARLAQDHATLTEGNGKDSIATVVESILGATSRLCEILQRMAQQRTSVSRNSRDAGELSASAQLNTLTSPFACQSTANQAEEPLQGSRLSAQTASDYRGGNHDARCIAPETSRGMPDVLVATTLVMAYIFLVRNWRCAFLRLRPGVVSGQVGTGGRDGLELPSLQIGSFEVRGNPIIQLLVLVEVVSGMLETVESTLGITYSAGCGSMKRKEGKCWAIPMDPVMVSIRETLLSQERAAGRGESLGEPSLKQLMEEVKRQLDRSR